MMKAKTTLCVMGWLLTGFAGAAWAQNSSAEADRPSTSIVATAKVLIGQDSQATTAFKPDAERVKAMVASALTNLTAKPTVAEAWRSVANTNEVIGIKVYSLPGPNVGTRKAVVAAVVEGLLDAGFPTNHIVVWDRYAAHLRLAGFMELAERYGVRVEGAVEAGFDAKTYYDTALIGSLVYGDLEFGSKDDASGRRSHVSKLVTQGMTKIISIPPLLNHNSASTTGNLFSLALGSVDNFIRFETGPTRLATAVPEIYALPALSDRVVLSITDALVAQYQGEDLSMLHYAVALNEIWMSRDPVALDALASEKLEKLRQTRGSVDIPVNWDLYKNAELLQLGVANTKRIQTVNLQP